MTSKPIPTRCGGTKRQPADCRCGSDPCGCTFSACPGCADCLPAVEAVCDVCNLPKCSDKTSAPYCVILHCHCPTAPEPKKEEVESETPMLDEMVRRVNANPRFGNIDLRDLSPEPKEEGEDSLYESRCPECPTEKTDAFTPEWCEKHDRPEPKKEGKCEKCYDTGMIELDKMDKKDRPLGDGWVACDCRSTTQKWEETFDIDAGMGFWGGHGKNHDHICDHVNHDWQKSFIRRLLAQQEAKHKEELNAIDLEVRNKFRPLLLEQAQIIEAKHQATLARCREAIEHVGNETDEEAMKLCEVHQAFTEGCGWCQERSEMLARVVEKR